LVEKWIVEQPTIALIANHVREAKHALFMVLSKTTVNPEETMKHAYAEISEANGMLENLRFLTCGEILRLTESIEGYMETWDTHDSLADFETFQLLYEKLCGLVGKEPKDLEELAYGLDADREP